MNMKPNGKFRIECIALIGGILLASRVCQSAEIYVAPGGSDSNPGTREKPFATLAAARDALRRASPGAMAGSTVYLRAGVYRLREKLAFGPQDSGGPNAKIVYRGFGDERPVLSGGVTVTGWTFYDPSRNIYKANAGRDLFRQVYIDGVPAIRARHPNGTIYGPFWRLAGADPANGRLLVPAGEWKAVAALGDMRGVELVHNLHWIQQRAKIGTVVDLGKTAGLTVDSPNVKSFFLKPPAWYGNAPCYFENSLAFVDQDREWFHDPASGFLYLKVPRGFDIARATVEIPRLPTVLELDATPRNPVHDIEFHGIGFELSNWIRPSVSSLAASQFAQPYAGSRSFDTLGLSPGDRQSPARQPDRIPWMPHSEYRGDWHSVLAARVRFRHRGVRVLRHCGQRDRGYAESRRNPPPDEQSTGVAVWNNRICRAGQVYTNGGHCSRALFEG